MIRGGLPKKKNRDLPRIWAPKDKSYDRGVWGENIKTDVGSSASIEGWTKDRESRSRNAGATQGQLVIKARARLQRLQNDLIGRTRE